MLLYELFLLLLLLK